MHLLLLQDDVAPNETMTALQADHVMVIEMRKIRR